MVFCAAIGANEQTILENTDSVGEHVCTWISTTAEGRTARTKIYNKVVSNFEAGEIHEPGGGHLADYADCPNQRLLQTFPHSDVQARGCTRIEVSLYTCPQNELSSEKPPTASRKPWKKFSSKTRRTAYSWSNRLANSGKPSPPAWTSALFSPKDRKAAFSSRGTPTQRPATESTCAPTRRRYKNRQSEKKPSCGRRWTSASDLVPFSGSTSLQNGCLPVCFSAHNSESTTGTHTGIR